MKFTVNVECDNAAFDGPEGFEELKRILAGLAARVYFDDATRDDPSIADNFVLRDINGNKVGMAWFS